MIIEPCPERDEDWDQGHSLADGHDALHAYKRCIYCKQVWRVSTDPVGHLIDIEFKSNPLPQHKPKDQGQ